MKKMFKFLTAAAVCAAATSMAAPQYPFKSYTYPHGNIIKYGDDAMIKDHFKKWKNAWMKDVNGETYILAPEGTCSTVSEAIAYGMLIMVYMDDGTNGAENDFKKLYSTWTNHGGAGAGMNWRIGCDGGTGSASDADFDAALALFMASKQWNNQQYYDDAVKMLTWMMGNDINGGHVKPGSGWNDYFNPSYAALASFEVFKSVDASWGNVLTTAAQDLLKCQNSKSGLVSDWHDWSSMQPTKNGKAAVAQPYVGFYDDAARTPWRTAWAYYWFGNADAKKFNDNIDKWLYDATHTGSGINSGYDHDGTPNTAKDRNFASSTFTGGLGLASASDPNGADYLGTVYNYLATVTACATAQGCGEGSVAGEKYYPSTLNLLYLLLMTGHMPNFLDMTGYTEFTPDPSLAPSLSTLDGQQMTLRDSTVGVSGFWNWGAYHDKYNLGTDMATVMNPDSGESPLFYKAELDQIVAEASMQIAKEPDWTEAKQKVCDDTPAQCELLYPSAGISMSFLSDDKKGVDLSALGVKSVRITAKVSGPVRMAVLNEITYKNDGKKNAGPGSEPGVFLAKSSDYTAQTFDLTPEEYGFASFTNNDDPEALMGGIFSWVDLSTIPNGSEIIKCVTGFKFEAKDKKGSIADVSIKAIEFLDASGNVIDPVKITGMAGVGTKPANIAANSSASTPVVGSSSSGAIIADGSSSGMAIRTKLVASFNARVRGMQVELSNASVGSDFTVFSMQGKVITSGKIMNATQTVTLPNKGAYLVRVGSEMLNVIVK